MSDSASNPYAAVAFDRDKLILEHVPLLKHLVGRMAFDLPASIDRDDLFGWGMVGLIQAADSWESGRGLKFSTYAYTKIRGAILDELRRSDFLPRGRREKVRELDRAVAELEQRTGVVPAPEDIAKELGITLEEVDEILLAAKTAGHASFDEEISSTLLERVSDPQSSDPQGSVEWNEMKELLVRTIQALPEQERTVITLYYGEELLLREIAEVLEVTESRVSQIHTRALYRLNRELCPRIGTTP
ncbi:MAG: FliA/WhiG family RNA polymerase sigma factor [Planctomycetes bacterium]|nr:FliA/WhiG family RNA polymerase sigma factor [Planctomycetota bacterium]